MKENKINKYYRIPKVYDSEGHKHSFINYVDTETKERKTLALNDTFVYTEAENAQTKKDAMTTGVGLGICATCATLYGFMVIAKKRDKISEWGRSTKNAIVSKVKNFKEKHKKKNNEPEEE